MNLHYIKDISSEGGAPILYLNHDSVNEIISYGVCFSSDEMFPGGVPVIMPTDVATYVTAGGEIVYANPTAFSFGKFTFSAIKSFKGGSDIEMWVASRPVVLGIGYSKVALPPIPLFRTMTASKLSLYAPPFFDRQFLAAFCVPFLDSLYNECNLMIRARDIVLEGDPFSITLYENMNNEQAIELRDSFFPKVLLSSQGRLTINQSISITAQVANSGGEPLIRDMEIFFTGINCEVSHNRKITTNGSTSIKVFVPFAEIGDVVRVKASSKYFTGIGDILIPVQEDD